MKKRILSVFLTAAILFGAASLSALGASNKIFTGENSRYKIEGEVYKAYDELYGLTENLGNALDDKDSAKIDQSQSNWKLVCNTSYEDRPVYYKMIFNNDDNYIDIGPCVNGRDFLYKFGAILNKSSKRMIISPVYTYAFAQNVKTSTASLVFTAPKDGDICIKNDGQIKTYKNTSPIWADTVQTVNTKINLNGKTVEGSEQEFKPTDSKNLFDYNNVYLTVKEGDVVDFLAWSVTAYAYTDFAPIISYLENQTTESIKALAIGNSLTEEATTYLHTAFSAIGVNDIKIGAYISENALSAYADEITSDSFSLTGAYTLCDNGVSGTAEQLTLKAAAEKAEWDVVILQSSSQDLNNTEFNKTIAAIKKCFPNAKLAYYGTAVPFGDDTHYAKHTDISDKAVLNVIDSVDYYIPAGTAIENCRTSYLGNRLKISGGSIIDGFQSDNGTMSETAKLIAAMTFAEELCDQVADWKYDSFSDVIKNETEFEIVKAAVRRAVMRPYRVTQYAENTSVTLSGDANCDGKVNICDLVRYGEFTARVNGTEVYKANCDTVKDNRLDEQDLGGIKKLLLAIG